MIKTHPETTSGPSGRVISDAMTNPTASAFWQSPVSPMERCFEGAVGGLHPLVPVMGFEAILAGKSPHVFGHRRFTQAGAFPTTGTRWDCPAGAASLTRAQLFATRLHSSLYPKWYDPLSRSGFVRLWKTMIATAQTHLPDAWREDHRMAGTPPGMRTAGSTAPICSGSLRQPRSHKRFACRPPFRHAARERWYGPGKPRQMRYRCRAGARTGSSAPAVAVRELAHRHLSSRW